jgi:hypothetical protein
VDLCSRGVWKWGLVRGTKKRGTRDETDLFAVESSVAAAKQPPLLPPASPKPTPPPLSLYLPTSLYLGQASLDRFYIPTYLPVTNGGGGLGWVGTVTYLPTYLPTYPWKFQPVFLLARLQLLVFFFLGEIFLFVAKVAIIHRKMKKIVAWCGDHLG